MIDWKKEKTPDKNFCGWCTNTPTSGSCNGSCFTRTDFMAHQNHSNKLAHVKSELEKLPELKKQLKQREIDLKEELSILKK